MWIFPEGSHSFHLIPKGVRDLKKAKNPWSRVSIMHFREPARPLPPTHTQGDKQNTACTPRLLQNQELAREMLEAQRSLPRDLSLPNPPRWDPNTEQSDRTPYQQIKRFPNIFPALWVHCFAFNWLKIQEPMGRGEKMGGISDGKEWSYTERVFKRRVKKKREMRGTSREKKGKCSDTRREKLEARGNESRTWKGFKMDKFEEHFYGFMKFPVNQRCWSGRD